jgi:hypothetical protein
MQSEAHFMFLAYEKFAGRRIKHDSYFWKQMNGRNLDQCWLVYSMYADAMFCYRYKLLRITYVRMDFTHVNTPKKKVGIS